MGCMFGWTETDTRVNLSNVWSMGKELKNLQMEIFIKVSIQEENLMVMENTIGEIAAILKVHLKMDWDKAMDYGKKGQKQVINTKESIKMIKRMALAYLAGPQEIFTKEIIHKI